MQLSDGLEALVSLVPAGCPRTGAGPGVAEKLEQFGFTQDPRGDKAALQGRSPVLAGVTSLGLCLSSGSLLRS